MAKTSFSERAARRAVDHEIDKLKQRMGKDKESMAQMRAKKKAMRTKR